MYTTATMPRIRTLFACALGAMLAFGLAITPTIAPG